MSWIALPIILVAAAPLPKPAPKPVAVQTHVVATVQIVAAEEIRFKDIGSAERASTSQQKRLRDGVVMIEFY